MLKNILIVFLILTKKTLPSRLKFGKTFSHARYGLKNGLRRLTKDRFGDKY